jgi:hypothetical protein
LGIRPDTFVAYHPFTFFLSAVAQFKNREADKFALFNSISFILYDNLANSYRYSPEYGVLSIFCYLYFNQCGWLLVTGVEADARGLCI